MCQELYWLSFSPMQSIGSGHRIRKGCRLLPNQYGLSWVLSEYKVSKHRLSNDKTNGKLETLLNQEIAFQRKWKRLTMTAYVITTFGTIIATSSATIFAALSRSTDAAILAATATVF